MIPQRIQRQRSKGWRMPSNIVYVGRGSKWGNPFKIGDRLDAIPHDLLVHTPIIKEEITTEDLINRNFAVEIFYIWVYYSNDPEAIWIRENIKLLKGKFLACWCKSGEKCHADYLLKIANV